MVIVVTTRRPIVDATLINDELDILRLRLRHLGPHVDHFYIAESPETYTGLPKPLHLTDNLHLFRDFADRMTVVVYEGPATAVGWAREEIARDSLRTAVRDLDPQTIIYFSDLDEWPTESQIDAMRLIEEPHGVPLDAYFRKANWRLECESPNYYAKASPVAALPANFTDFRWPRSDAPYDFYPHLAGEPGCHFSYLGFEPDRIANKVAAFSHSEYLFAMTQAANLMRVCDKLALDHYGRSRAPGHGLLTVLKPAQWTSLHHWLSSQHPEWFDTHNPGNTTWRRMNAAVIDDAMLEEDLAKLRLVGGIRVLTQKSAWRSVRSRLGSVKRRLLGR